MNAVGGLQGEAGSPQASDPNKHLRWIPPTTWVLAGLGIASVALDVLMLLVVTVGIVVAMVIELSGPPSGTGPPVEGWLAMAGVGFSGAVMRALTAVPLGLGCWGAECLRRGGPRLWVLVGALSLLGGAGLQLCAGLASGVAYGCVPLSLLTSALALVASVFMFVGYSEATFPEVQDRTSAG